jgi:signal transduction histidine kinase/ABC-type uncharacterized transport system substrate-binding protein
MKQGWRVAALCIFRAAIIGSLSLSGTCADAVEREPKRVLLLHSFGPNFRPWSEYAKSIRAELERRSPWPLDITEQSLIAARFADDNPEAPFAEYVRALFLKHPLDLIVSVGAPAAQFVQRHRERVFGATPMIFTAVEQRRVQFTSLTENDSVVAVKHDLPAAIENILRVLPNTKIVTVVNGTSPLERFWLEEMHKEFKPFEGRITFAWTNTQSFQEILRQAAAPLPQSAIFWELMIVDAAGVVHQGDKALAQLHSVANAPIFSFDDSFFGGELVGGPMHAVSDTASRTAEVAIRILGGEKPGEIKSPPIGFAAPKYNWKEMQRWGISESDLPPGSTIYFRDSSAWEKYRPQIAGALFVLLLQGALISWLIYEHWRRQRAEATTLQLTHELARINRFATAGQLSASIAHEIRQPLTAVSTSAAAGLNWLKKTVPDIQQIKASLERVIDATHRADDVIKGMQAIFRNEPTKRVEVGLNELVRQVVAVTEGAIKSNNITLQLGLSDDKRAVILADPIQLQQVILNLMLNAIEALSASEGSAKILRIETGVDSTDAVFLAVEDSGPGFDKNIAGNVFDALVTTKPNGMGIGLSICKSIVEQHQGRITASAIRPRGAMLRIVLPRAHRGAIAA